MRKGRSEKRHLSETAASEFVARRGGSSFQISEVRETVGRHQQVLKRSRGKLKIRVSIHATSIYSGIAMINNAPFDCILERVALDIARPQEPA